MIKSTHRLTRRRRLLAGSAVAVVAAVSLAACGSDDTNATDSTPTTPASAAASGGSAAPADFGAITVQLSWIKNAEFAGEFEADTNGYYQDEGFSGVTLTPGPGPTENIVGSGKADFGLSNAVSTAQAIANSGAPIKIVGTTYQKNPFTILSLADAGNIATPADLKGKKIGVQDSNLSLFDAFLAANGMSEDDLTVVPVQYDPSVLVDGQVDGFVAYLTNESIIVSSEGHPVTNLPFADNGLPFVAESIIASDDTIANKPDMVKAFLAAEIKGWKDACADPAAGAGLAVDTYGKDLKLDIKKETEQAQIQCTDLINTDDTKENGTFTISQDQIDQNMASLAGAGIDIAPEDLFDTSLLDQLLTEQPDLKVTG